MKKIHVCFFVLIGFFIGFGVCSYAFLMNRDVEIIHYQSELEIRHEQLHFLIRLVEKGDPVVANDLLEMLNNDDIEYYSRSQGSYVYVGAKFLVFKFDERGKLISVVSDK